MKRILTTLSEKWPEYLLEILVLIIGIYGAFGVDNWNETRLEKKEEQEILKNLRADFKGTVEELERLNRIRVTLFETNETIDRITVEKRAGNLEQIGLDSIIVKLLYLPTFNSKGSALEALTNSGKISLIKNPEIRNRLISWPGLLADMQEGEMEDVRIYTEALAPVMLKHIAMADLMAKFKMPTSLFQIKIKVRPQNITLFQSDYEGLLEDRDFINSVDNRIIMNMIAYDETHELIVESNRIINMIEQEIIK